MLNIFIFLQILPLLKQPILRYLQQNFQKILKMNNYQYPENRHQVPRNHSFNGTYIPESKYNVPIQKNQINNFRNQEKSIRFYQSPSKKNFQVQKSINPNNFCQKNQQVKGNTHSISNLKGQLSNSNIHSQFNMPYQSLNLIRYFQSNTNDKAHLYNRSQNLYLQKPNTFQKASNYNSSENKASLFVYETNKLSNLQFQTAGINKREFTNLNIQKTAASSAVTQNKEDNYTIEGVAGKGTFGTVYFGKDIITKEKIAHKKVLLDKRYKNRELQILQQAKHPNIIRMRDSFISTQDSSEYLNIIMDYFPQSLGQCIKKRVLNPHQIKSITYQVFKGLQYLSLKGIAHRDIKPHNILIDRGSLKAVICDFGSAKKLVKGQKNLAYICSRCFRAAQLIFGSTQYNSQVDVWSMGCILFQMVNGKLPFVANSQSDLFVEIVKILGTPTQKDAFEMNEKYDKNLFNKLPRKVSLNWSTVLKTNDVQLIDLISKILVYSPKKRLNPRQVLNHPYFDSLKDKIQPITLNKNSVINRSTNLLQFKNQSSRIQKQKQYGKNYLSSQNKRIQTQKQNSHDSVSNYSQQQSKNTQQSNTNIMKNVYQNIDRQFPTVQRLSHHIKNSTEAQNVNNFRPQTQRDSPNKINKHLPLHYLTRY